MYPLDIAMTVTMTVSFALRAMVLGQSMVKNWSISFLRVCGMVHGMVWRYGRILVKLKFHGIE